MKYPMFLMTMILMAGVARGAVVGKNLDYKEGKKTLEGYAAYDDSISGKRPGVVVVPDWMGPSDFTKGRADGLAKMGYVAFVADIYGKGMRPKDSQEAAKLSSEYKSDRPLLRARARAALDSLIARPQTDPTQVVVIGYCFGGTAALELARSGAPLVGIVSFHGGLDTPTPQDAKNIKGRVLALTGSDDPYVPPSQIEAFEKEMKDGGVDWELVRYGGAVHAFAIPSAGNDNSTGAAYNPEADRRSWQAMKDFFSEIFK